LYCNEVAVDEETGDQVSDAVYYRTREVEELYGVKIKPVLIDVVDVPTRSSGGMEILKFIQAGEDAFDFAMINGNSLVQIFPVINNFVELNSIASLDLSHSWWNQNVRESISIGGRLYTAHGDISLYGYIGAECALANKKLIDDYGLDNPYDLVRNKKWTWDKLYEMSRTVVVDVNGDGIIDLNDKFGLMAETAVLLFAVMGSGVKLASKDSEGMPYITAMSERTVAVVDKMFRILTDDTTTYIAKITEDFYTARDKFHQNEILFYVNQIGMALQSRGMENDFAILPRPWFDENQGQYYVTVTPSFATFVCIPNTCSNVERTATVLDALGYYSQKYVRPAFFDVTVTNKMVRDEDSLEMLGIIYGNCVYDLGYIFNWGSLSSVFSTIISTRNNTFVSSYDSIANKIETDMQKTLEAFGIN